MPVSFDVRGWRFDASGRMLTLAYRLEHPELGVHDLQGRIELPVAVAVTPVIDRLASLLAVAAGVSYCKAVAPERISFGDGIALDPAGTAAMAALYDEGLREFSYGNGLALPRPIALPAPSAPVAASPGPSPLLLAIGDNPYAPRVAAATGLQLVVARRSIDQGLLDLNAAGAMNGHVPVTAINSLISILIAVATGCSSVVMANERSASQPTRVVDGVEINHQYSKSFAFERLLREALVPIGVTYYSALRPWGELPIAAAFARCEAALQHAFMSCNRAFIRDPSARSDGWCGNCAKCRSVFLSLAPFMSPDALSGVFGRDLLADDAQLPGFLELVDPAAKQNDPRIQAAEELVDIIHSYLT